MNKFKIIGLLLLAVVLGSACTNQNITSNEDENISPDLEVKSTYVGEENKEGKYDEQGEVTPAAEVADGISINLDEMKEIEKLITTLHSGYNYAMCAGQNGVSLSDEDRETCYKLLISELEKKDTPLYQKLLNDINKAYKNKNKKIAHRIFHDLDYSMFDNGSGDYFKASQAAEYVLDIREIK